MRTRSVKFAALLAAVVVVQVGLGGPASAAKGRTLREAYVGGTNIGLKSPGYCRPDWLNPTGKNVGMVCFTGLTSGKYKITVHDVTGLDVAFNYVWDGDWAHVGYACKTVTLTSPPDAWRLEIYLNSPLWDWCPGITHSATKGEVTLTKLAR